MGEMIIAGTECEKNNCKFYNELYDLDKNKIYCGAKDKTYYIGSCIPCSLMEKEEME